MSIDWRDSLDPNLARDNRDSRLLNVMVHLAEALFCEGRGKTGMMLEHIQIAASNIVAWRDSLDVEDRWVNLTEWDEARSALLFAMERVLEAEKRYVGANDVDTLLAGAETALRCIWERHNGQAGDQPQ